MADAIGGSITTPETGAVAPASSAVVAPVLPDKFKNADGSVNAEALLASYVELEKKQGAPKVEGEQPDAAAVAAAAKPEVTTEESNVSSVLKAAGLELDPFNAEYAKDGKLSEASFAALEAKGFSKATVEMYIRGVVASNADVANTLTDIKSVAGGDDGYTNMVSWAANSLDAAQIADFNEAVTSGKPAIAKAAVQAMKAEFDKAEGRDPTLIGGNSKVTGETFRSWGEVEASMKDPRYGKDPAYTRDVEQKAIRSSI